MPVKRRRSKRRKADSFEPFIDMFLFGCDFHGGLKEAGLTDPEALPPGAERDAAEAALREAWAEFGDDFLRAWIKDGDDLPWAAWTFGMPEEAAKCR